MIFEIEIYKLGDTWFFDRKDLGIEREAFVAGASELIQHVLDSKGIAAKSGVNVQFSNIREEIEEPDIELHVIEKHGSWDYSRFFDVAGYGVFAHHVQNITSLRPLNSAPSSATYRCAKTGMECWLCPAQLKFFGEVADDIYAKITYEKGCDMYLIEDLTELQVGDYCLVSMYESMEAMPLFAKTQLAEAAKKVGICDIEWMSALVVGKRLADAGEVILDFALLEPLGYPVIPLRVKGLPVPEEVKRAIWGGCSEAVLDVLGGRFEYIHQLQQMQRGCPELWGRIEDLFGQMYPLNLDAIAMDYKL